jgi:ankyrin repeat protein
VRLPLFCVFLSLCGSGATAFSQTQKLASTQKAAPSDLVKAARSGQNATVLKLLAEGADVKVQGAKALNAAVRRHHLETVRILVKHGAPVSFDALSWVLSQWLLTSEELDVIRTLIAGGANLNEVGAQSRIFSGDSRFSLSEDGDLTTPLMLSISFAESSQARQNGVLTKLLIAKGAKVNQALPNGKTALDEAISSYLPIHIGILIEGGADLRKHQKRLLAMGMSQDDGLILNALQKRGAIPSRLSFASMDFSVTAAAVKAILARGGNPNERMALPNRWTVLHRAAYEGQVESVRALLNAGAKIEAKADYWNNKRAQQGITDITPIFLAGENNTNSADGIRTLQLLLSRGANPNAVDNHNGWSVLMWKAIRSDDGYKMVPQLLKAGAKTEVVDRKGQSVLHLAAINSKANAVVTLVKANHKQSFLEARDKSGRTALQWAVAPPVGHMEDAQIRPDDSSSMVAIRALVNAGASVRVKDNRGSTLLHLAVASNPELSVTKLTYLVSKGLKPMDIKDSKGATPLLMACENVNVEAATYLLNHGANPDTRNKAGLSPRKLSALPVHPVRPRASNAQEKKYIDMMYKRMDEMVNQRRKTILLLINGSRSSAKH